MPSTAGTSAGSWPGRSAVRKSRRTQTLVWGTPPPILEHEAAGKPAPRFPKMSKPFVSPFCKQNTVNVGLELTFGHEITSPQLNIKTKQNVLGVELIVSLHLRGFFFYFSEKTENPVSH